MLSSAISIIEAVVGFSLLIFVHELGHFLAAKWQGIRVEVFSLGFGPCLKRQRGDTEYRLSLIPLGGYVKLAGEEPSAGKKPKPDEFYAKTAGRRAIVFVAGVVMNIVFGFVFFILAYQVGVPVVPAKVGMVESGSPAWKLGIKRGDVITRVNDLKSDLDFEDLKTTVVLAGKGEKISLEIERDGHRFEVGLVPAYDKELGRMYAGIAPYSDAIIAEFDATKRRKQRYGTDYGDPDDFATIFEAGLQAGDRITSVHLDGRPEPMPVLTPEDFFYAVDSSGGKPVRIAFARNGVSQPPVTVMPAEVGADAWRVGVVLGSTNTLAAVRENSWADDAGFKEGDTITSVGNKPSRSASEAVKALDATAEKGLKVVVLRAGAEKILHVATRKDGKETLAVLAFESEELFIDIADPGYPAETAGIEPGDRVISVNGEPINETADFQKIVRKSKGLKMRIAWQRNGEKMQADVTPAKRWMIAVPWEPTQMKTRAGIGRSFRLGARKSYQWIVRIYMTLRSLLLRNLSPRHLSGPLSIVYITYAAARTSVGTLFYFLAVLSVNLGVINLLPIPVLDGGHLLFTGIEKVRGKPLSERIRAAAGYAGLVLILSIFVVAFWNDIWTLFLR